MFLNLLFVLLTKKVRKVLTGVLARILTLLLVYLLDDWHLNRYVLLNLAQLVFLSLRYVPLMTTFILISFIVFQYGHQIIPQTWIVLLYFRKKWFVLLPKKHLMPTLILCSKNFKYWSFPTLICFKSETFSGFLADVFTELFSMTNQVHSYYNRNSKSSYLFPARTNIRRFTLRFQGPRFFSRIEYY